MFPTLDFWKYSGQSNKVKFSLPKSSIFCGNEFQGTTTKATFQANTGSGTLSKFAWTNISPTGNH
jgi:hypothetical protein